MKSTMCKMKEFPLTLEEVRSMIKKEETKKYTILTVSIVVVTILVGLIIWVAKRREKDLEEHYEYFDDDFDDLDENFDDLDDSIYEDENEEDEKVEYVTINDFMKEDKEADSEKASEEKAHHEDKEDIEEKEDKE